VAEENGLVTKIREVFPGWSGSRCQDALGTYVLEHASEYGLSVDHDQVLAQPEPGKEFVATG
jgi:hypothetical protein